MFIPARHGQHQPAWDYSDGLPPFPHLERPERVDRVLAGFTRVRETVVHHVEEADEQLVRALHDGGYVDCLRALDGALDEDETFIPAVFRDDPRDAPVRVRAGGYCREIGTPVAPGTLDAALNAASTAHRAAQHLVRDGGPVAALCRPPGHHAGLRRYGGYCYFNNAYVAAGVLAEAGRCAVLDVDYHLGDGSMEFATPETPYYSLHADPGRSYPYLAGSEGAAGNGVNLTSLPPGASAAAYQALLDGVVADIRQLEPAFLVLSLGFDTLGSDYIQDQPVGLRPSDFRGIGASVAALGARTLFLLEGGYDTAALADCAEQFLIGYEAAYPAGGA